MKMATAVYVSSVLFMLVVSAGTPAYASRGRTRTPIRHLTNIYFENHTFDNFFVDPIVLLVLSLVSSLILARVG